VNIAKKTIPSIIAFVVGVFMWMQYYIPHNSVQAIYKKVVTWDLVIAGFAAIVGIYSLLHLHAQKMKRKEKGWGYSVVVYIAMATMVIAGFGFKKHMAEGGPFSWIFNNMLVAMSSTMFSLLAFYIISAAYRAFRARTREATILLITAIIVMMGRVPIGEAMFGALVPKYHAWLPNFTEWILNTPNMAAQRGIMLGVGLASIATSLRIIFGIERTYMGGGD
jgi:hypothetical protein